MHEYQIYNYSFYINVCFLSCCYSSSFCKNRRRKSDWCLQRELDNDCLYLDPGIQTCLYIHVFICRVNEKRLAPFAGNQGLNICCFVKLLIIATQKLGKWWYLVWYRNENSSSQFNDNSMWYYCHLNSISEFQRQWLINDTIERGIFVPIQTPCQPFLKFYVFIFQ